MDYSYVSNTRLSYGLLGISMLDTITDNGVELSLIRASKARLGYGLPSFSKLATGTKAGDKSEIVFMICNHMNAKAKQSC